MSLTRPPARQLVSGAPRASIGRTPALGALPLEWAPFTGARAYAVASHGAECAPLAAQAVAARPLDSAAHRTRAASWDWLEQSLQQRRVLSVSEHPHLKPLEARLPLPGFRELKMSLTGFEVRAAAGGSRATPCEIAH